MPDGWKVANTRCHIGAVELRDRRHGDHAQAEGVARQDVERPRWTVISRLPTTIFSVHWVSTDSSDSGHSTLLREDR